MSESCKTLTIIRRLATGIYGTFQSPVLDVGAGPATPGYDWATRVAKRGGPAIEVHRFDQEHGDAQSLDGVADKSYPTVYASHVLEHLPSPMVALTNWLRVCRVGGRVFIAVPHRRLYECGKEAPPSFWAGNQHLWFFEPDRHRGPKVLGLAQLLLVDMPHVWQAAGGMEMRLDYLATCDWGYEAAPGVHPRGEYQIEAALVRTR
jgi:SAM-dependent methyltransferase